MPITQLIRGDLLAANAQILVNPVNCVGVMGKGLALQFKRTYPDNYTAYRQACDTGLVHPGKVFSYREANGIWIANFPTKRHWRDTSLMEDIELGIVDLVQFTRTIKARNIAIPPLGCGLGGLKWSEVKPSIIQAFGNDSITLMLFEP
ncbi:macro domain-containing protein [Merismopedia glauca]|uniref:Appr-1-p processing domain-containing protein n=1 Tax=Merismopedia glauca CCAP 1448/3 TaxID=1296344 RepID=A0A2T1BWK0_9CYAN|nr:macro domain-containing protein [Merismopedia glauca]PSB00386.1 appr-1-p processing domain-containing protein [Merismopedia glauca CCAP 1448/3]